MANAHTPTPRTRPGGILGKFIVTLFLLTIGFFVGAYVTAYSVISQARPLAQHPEYLPAVMTGMLDRRLALTDEQSQQVHEILHRRLYIQYYAEDENFRRLLRAHAKRMREEIAGVLTDEQKAKWDELYAVIEKDWMPRRLLDEPPATAPAPKLGP